MLSPSCMTEEKKWPREILGKRLILPPPGIWPFFFSRFSAESRRKDKAKEGQLVSSGEETSLGGDNRRQR